MNNIICVVDSTEHEIEHFQLTDPAWTIERLQEEFFKDKIPNGWSGQYYRFVRFIKERGAIKIEIETINAPSYPDIIDWD